MQRNATGPTLPRLRAPVPYHYHTITCRLEDFCARFLPLTPIHTHCPLDPPDLQSPLAVTIAHSKTKDLKETLSTADIVIAAVGRMEMITGEMLKPGCVVIDVGINSKDDPTDKRGYKLVGDCDFESCKEVAGKVIYLVFSKCSTSRPRSASLRLPFLDTLHAPLSLSCAALTVPCSAPHCNVLVAS
jgi:hypothetical protein